MDPAFARIVQQANDALAKGAYREAADGFAKIVAADPFNHIAFQGLAIASLCLNERDSALDAITRALILDPGCIEYLIVRAEVHRLAKDFDRARADLEHALELAPAAFAVHNNLGVIEKAARNYAAAQAHLEKAIALKPDYVDAIYNLARLSAQTGDIAASVRYLARARQLLPADPRFLVQPNQLVEILPESKTSIPGPSAAASIARDDAKKLEILGQRLGSGQLRLALDVGKLTGQASPVARASDSNQVFAAVFAAMALVVWLAPLVVSIPVALALLGVYQVLLPRFLGIRLRRRILSQTVKNLDEWQKLWQFGGIVLSSPDRPEGAKDWREFVDD